MKFTETIYLGDDIIEVDCIVTQTADIEECHGISKARHETEIEIKAVRVFGHEVCGLSSKLVEKLKEEAGDQLFDES